MTCQYFDHSIRSFGILEAADNDEASPWEPLLRSGLRYALSLTHDSDEAEDLLQDAVTSVLSARTRFNKSYLYTTIRNRFIDRVRRSRRVSFVPLSPDPSEPGDDGSLRPDRRDVFAARQLDRALAELRPEERETLFLAVVEGYTASEIGRLTGKPRGTILSLLHRSRRRLRALMQE